MDMAGIGDQLFSPFARLAGGICEVGCRLAGSRGKKGTAPPSDIEATDDSSCISSTAFIVENNTDDGIVIHKIASIQDGKAFSLPECPFYIAPRDFKEVVVPMGGKNLRVKVSYEVRGTTRNRDFLLCEEKEAE